MDKQEPGAITEDGYEVPMGTVIAAMLGDPDAVVEMTVLTLRSQIEHMRAWPCRSERCVARCANEYQITREIMRMPGQSAMTDLHRAQIGAALDQLGQALKERGIEVPA